ncbi:MAG: hydantoinase/oxoprolinase family protein, partial [Pseudomonadota bacterium]
ASAAVRVATAKMATELTKLLAQRGLDPRGFALVAYGGAGPTHANLLAEEARLDAVVVPRAPGTFCALGAILADVRRDYVRPARFMISRDEAGFDRVADTLAEVEREALAWIAHEGALIGDHQLRLSADMRYPAQAFELNIQVPEEDRASLSARHLIDLFNAEHERLYGFQEAGSEVQVTNLRLGVVGKVPPVRLPEVREAPLPEPVALRRVFHDDWRDVPVYDRATIGAGAVIDGPAIVEQPDSTVWILPDWRARADALGNLLITRI